MFIVTYFSANGTSFFLYYQQFLMMVYALVEIAYNYIWYGIVTATKTATAHMECIYMK